MSSRDLLPSEYERYLREFFEKGHFAGRVIVLVDPDDPSGRTRNVYEDLDFEVVGEARFALVTCYPEAAKADELGNYEGGRTVVDHKKALQDVKIMIERFGYKIHKIDRDI